MILACGFALSSNGNAVIPSISGISMSRTTTSGSAAAIVSTAIRPLGAVPAMTNPGSDSIQRVMKPRIAAESSTTITRISASGFSDVAVVAVAARVIVMELRPSDQTDFAELGFDDF